GGDGELEAIATHDGLVVRCSIEGRVRVTARASPCVASSGIARVRAVGTRAARRRTVGGALLALAHGGAVAGHRPSGRRALALARPAGLLDPGGRHSLTGLPA